MVHGTEVIVHGSEVIIYGYIAKSWEEGLLTHMIWNHPTGPVKTEEDP